MAASQLTAGTYYTVYQHDATTGVEATLTGAGATLTRASTFAFGAAQESALQRLHARQLLCVYANGTLAVSYNGGQTWTTATVSGKTLTASALDVLSATNYPHGYVGASDGNLYALNDTQAALATWSVSATLGSTGSQITALCQPPGGGHGKVWLGCSDGSLWLYAPTQGLVKMAQFSGAITGLAHWVLPSRVVVACADATMGLAIADELAIGASLLVLKQTAVIGVATARRAALLAAGAASLSWSPSGGLTLGSLSLPGTISGNVSALAISPLDPNEILLGSASGQLFRSYDNATTWTTLSAPPGTALGLFADPTTPGAYYARLSVTGTPTAYVSYDAGATWTSLGTGVASTCNDLALGALCMQ